MHATRNPRWRLRCFAPQLLTSNAAAGAPTAAAGGPGDVDLPQAARGIDTPDPQAKRAKRTTRNSESSGMFVSASEGPVTAHRPGKEPAAAVKLVSKSTFISEAKRLWDPAHAADKVSANAAATELLESWQSMVMPSDSE